MSTSRVAKESLPNMVAGKGFERFGPPDFTETDFDGWVLFLRAYLGRFDRAHLALDQEYPEEVVDEDGSEIQNPTKRQVEALEESQAQWITRNQLCYSTIMGICLLNTKSKIVVKQYKGENARELLDLLKKRFQIV